jgi:hypothetical protein
MLTGRVMNFGLYLAPRRGRRMPAGPMAARYKVWVCGRSPDEMVGSNPTGDMDICREYLCCQTEVSATS